MGNQAVNFTAKRRTTQNETHYKPMCQRGVSMPKNVRSCHNLYCAGLGEPYAQQETVVD